jgi:hypothetical protein
MTSVPRVSVFDHNDASTVKCEVNSMKLIITYFFRFNFQVYLVPQSDKILSNLYIQIYVKTLDKLEELTH